MKEANQLISEEGKAVLYKLDRNDCCPENSDSIQKVKAQPPFKNLEEIIIQPNNAFVKFRIKRNGESSSLIAIYNNPQTRTYTVIMQTRQGIKIIPPLPHSQVTFVYK